MLWRVQQGRRLLCFRPTTHVLDEPVVSQALATAQEGKAVTAGLLWGVLSHTHFPQPSGLQPWTGAGSPSGTVDLCTHKPGEIWQTPCKRKTEA